MEQRISGVVALAEVATRAVDHAWDKSLARARGDWISVDEQRGHARTGDRDTEMLPCIELDCPGRNESRHASVLPDLEFEVIRGPFPSQDNIIATTWRVAEVKVSGVVADCRSVRPEAGTEAGREVSKTGGRCIGCRSQKRGAAIECLCVGKSVVGRRGTCRRIRGATQRPESNEVVFVARVAGRHARCHLCRGQRRVPDAEAAHLALEGRIGRIVALANEVIRTSDDVRNKSRVRGAGDSIAVHVQGRDAGARDRDAEILPRIELDHVRCGQLDYAASLGNKECEVVCQIVPRQNDVVAIRPVPKIEVPRPVGN